MASRSLPVICGDTTCYDFESEKMCRFVRVTHFGTKWVCGVYLTREGDHVRLRENADNCLLRDPQCLKEIG